MRRAEEALAYGTAPRAPRGPMPQPLIMPGLLTSLWGCSRCSRGQPCAALAAVGVESGKGRPVSARGAELRQPRLSAVGPQFCRQNFSERRAWGGQVGRCPLLCLSGWLRAPWFLYSYPGSPA